MSYNSILNFLDNGVSSEEILSQIKNSSPKISKKISQMFMGGYGASEIVKYLLSDNSTKNMGSIKSKPSTPSEIANMSAIQNAMNVPKSRDDQARNDLMRLTPTLIAAGSAMASAAGYGAAGKAVSELMPVTQQQQQTPEPQPTSNKSLFRKLTGDIDISQLDEKTTKELNFLELIARQLESKGKTEKDKEVKSLKNKIQKALKGMTGMIESEAMQMPQENIPQPEQQQQMTAPPQQQQPQPGMQQQQDPAYNDLLDAIKQAQGLNF